MNYTECMIVAITALSKFKCVQVSCVLFRLQN